MMIPSIPARLLGVSLLALTFLLGGNPVFAENSWSFDGPQTNPIVGDVSGRGMVAIGPDREVYCAFTDFQAGSADVFFRRSTDFGVTWSTPIKVDTDALGLNDSWLTALLTDGDWIYVVYLDRRQGTGAFQALRLNVSNDRGLTWLQQDRLLCDEPACSGAAQLSLGQPGEIYAAVSSGVHASRDHGTTWARIHEFLQSGGYPRISSDTLGNIYAVKLGPLTQPGYGTGLSIDVSHDGGLSWFDPVEIETRPVSELSHHVSCDPWGNVYVGFLAVIEDETSHVFVSHSNDAGENFSPPVQIDDDVDLTGSPISPLLASDCSGNAYVLYAPPAKLVLTHDVGNTWSPTPIPIQESTAAGAFPALTVDPNGRVFIAYDSWDVDGRRIRFDHSADEGRSWLNEDVLVSNTPSQPALVSDGEGHAYVTWYGGGFRVGHADLGTSLTSGPERMTFVTIPPEGGSVRLTGAARNSSGSSIEDLPVVLELLAPDGSSIEVLARKRLSLQEGGLRRRSVRRSVAGALPPGQYRFRIMTADPLADQAFFCVMKE